MAPTRTRLQKRKLEEAQKQQDSEGDGKRFRDQMAARREGKESEEVGTLPGNEEQPATANVCIQKVTTKIAGVPVEVQAVKTEMAIKMSLEDLMNEVFRLPELREKIVGHVIQHEIKRGSSRSDVRSLRLVCETWLQDVSSYLHKSGQPLYQLHLTDNNSLTTSHEVQQNGRKHLDRFIGEITSRTRLEAKIPPFSLKIGESFFREENYQSFSDFLARCASGLVKLEMVIPRNGGSLTFIFPGVNIALPNLRNLVLGFPQRRILGQQEEDRYSNESNSAVLPFLQSLLSGCLKLTAFMILDFQGRISHIPSGVRYLRLPPTLTTLCFSLYRNLDLESFMNQDFPHLRNLYISVFNEQFASGLITRILEKFRLFLRNLRINNHLISPILQSPPNFFRFPRMEKLETFYLSARTVEPEEGHPPLPILLPKLNTLALLDQSMTSIERCTTSSIFTNVTTLKINLHRQEAQVKFNLGNHFPNLSTLTLWIKNEADAGELRKIFLEMPRFKRLEVYFPRRGVPSNNGTWDSTFTGIPVERLLELRKNPDLNSLNLQENRNLASIVNLQSLENLVLWAPPTVARESLISDLVFQLAFLQMPNLKKLEFEGGFKVSAEMAQVWRNRGCVLFEDGLRDRRNKTSHSIWP